MEIATGGEGREDDDTIDVVEWESAKDIVPKIATEGEEGEGEDTINVEGGGSGKDTVSRGDSEMRFARGMKHWSFAFGWRCFSFFWCLEEDTVNRNW